MESKTRLEYPKDKKNLENLFVRSNSKKWFGQQAFSKKLQEGNLERMLLCKIDYHWKIYLFDRALAVEIKYLEQYLHFLMSVQGFIEREFPSSEQASNLSDSFKWIAGTPNCRNKI